MNNVNHCYQAKPGTFEQRWYVVDATDKVLGRLAVKLATVLTGKNKPTYTSYIDTGDFVVVVNAEKVKVTGSKQDEVMYESYSRYPGGRKVVPMRDMLKKHPERVIEEAVRRMMPKNALARRMILKMKLYAGPDHPHQAQMPEPLK